MTLEIISGGQTGVDRAALDWAMANGLRHGGFCPKGRRAEDGRIPAIYRLSEMPTPDYNARTRKNIDTSDGTLIIKRGPLKGGTAYTVGTARLQQKPLFIVDAEEFLDENGFRDWLKANKITVLNIAGPRESQSPGIGRSVGLILDSFLARHDE